MWWFNDLFKRSRTYESLAEEIEQHLEEKREALVDAGMSPAAAEHAARRQFGNASLIEERGREVWRLPAIENVWADIKFAWRQMRHSPTFAATTVIILALGIGVNTAIYSIVHHVLLEPLPFAQPNRLFAIFAESKAQGQSRIAASGPDFLDYQDQSKSFAAIAEAIPIFTFSWTSDGEPRLVNCTAISQDFFQVLGIQPHLGRLYTPREYTSLTNDTMIVSYRFWKNQLGGDPHVIGRVIHLGGEAATIIAVLPPMADLFPDTDVWPKLTTRPSWDYMKWRNNKFLTVIGRLKPSVTPATAEEELTGILRRAPDQPKDVRVRLNPLKDDLVGSVRRELQMIMAAVALVLLVACGNVAALLLARTAKRGPEIAMRQALGASRSRVKQQLVVESLVLTTIGCSLGVLAGWLSLHFISQVLMSQSAGLQIPRAAGIHLNAAVLMITIFVGLATALFFGLIPALGLSDLNLSATLRSGRTTTSRTHHRLFSLLIIAEIACAVVLSVGGTLMLRSLWRAEHVELGFQPDHMLTTYLRTNHFSPEGRAFWQDVIDGLSSLPGVSAAAAADCTPVSRAAEATVVFDDRANDPNHAPGSQGCWISPDFFRVTQTPIIRGRFFAATDNADSPPVALINQEAARRFWPGENPLGKKIGVNYTGPGRVSKGAPRWREVIGVVGDVKQNAIELPAQPSAYMPYLQDETNHVLASMNIYVRSTGDPLSLAHAVREKIQAIDPKQPVDNIRTMPELVGRALSSRRFSLSLIGSFAALAILLSAIGIYGVVSYTTLQRDKEFGVRIALGANRSDLVLMVLKQGLLLTGIGTVSGIIVAGFAARAMSQMLFEVGPLDALSFATGVSILILVSVCACIFPAWRVSRLDPIDALRTE